MFKVCGLLVIKILLVSLATCQEYVDPSVDQIVFNLFNNGKSSVSTFNTSMSQQGCDMNGNFSIVVHGFMGSASPWIPDLIGNLSRYRSGCVLFTNATYYSDRGNYFEVVRYFEPLSKLLAKKLNQIVNDGASSDNIYMFGFSYGGRVVIEAGLLFGHQKIGLIDS